MTCTIGSRDCIVPRSSSIDKVLFDAVLRRPLRITAPAGVIRLLWLSWFPILKMLGDSVGCCRHDFSAMRHDADRLQFIAMVIEYSREHPLILRRQFVELPPYDIQEFRNVIREQCRPFPFGERREAFAQLGRPSNHPFIGHVQFPSQYVQL